MKYIAIIFLSLYILSTGCFPKNDCDGEDVNVGELLLMDESITDFAQYEDMVQLTFNNSEGDSLILTQTRNALWAEQLNSKLICNTGGGGSFFGGGSTKWEHYDAESWSFVYEDGENRLDFVLSIAGEMDDERNLLLDKVFDKITYTYSGFYQGVRIELVANDRQNSISPDVLSRQEVVHYDEIEINDRIYQDVWSFNYEFRTERSDPPMFYVKQGVGVLAFRDVHETLWNIVN